VGKVINIASRSAKFVTELSDVFPVIGYDIFLAAAKAGDEIAKDYEARNFAAALKKIMTLADNANKFIDDLAPWSLEKEDQQKICSVALNLFWQIMIYLSPVLPNIAKQAEELLNAKITEWNDSKTPLLGNKVNPFKHMLTRIKDVETMLKEG
jgi:methionyl-tRNA synthetase